jgi:acyl carrier protein
VHSKERIESWMTEYLADRLRANPSSLDPDASFERLGLDSAAAVEMLGDLETWLGVGDLDPTLPYDYPSLSTLSAHLATLRP